VRGSHLQSGNVKSCGCIRQQTPASSQDLSGSVHGELKIIEKAVERLNNPFFYSLK